MPDEWWVGRNIVEYYIEAGVGSRLIPLRAMGSHMQPPPPPPRSSPPAGAPLVPPSPHRTFPRPDDRFEPQITSRTPAADRPSTPFPADCAEFCFPNGIQLATLAEHQQNPIPVTNSFVLTTGDRTRVYGVCITWMDALDPEIVRRFIGDPTERAHADEVYAQQCVCLISRVPAFELLTECCRYLYRMHITEGMKPLKPAHVQPALDARIAPPGEPTTLSLGGLRIESPSPAPLDFPRSLASASDWLVVTKCLDAHNLVSVWALLLAEQKLLLLSAHTHVLTMACESLVGLLFPLAWEHVYVPVLPARLSGFLQAPVPFLVGATPDVVSETNEIPPDVVQVHLDDNTVILDRALYSKLRLPPRARRKLMRTLARVCRPATRRAPAGAGGERGGGGGGAAAPAHATLASAEPLTPRRAPAAGVHGDLVSAFQLPPHPDELDGASETAYDSDGTEQGERPDPSAPSGAARLVKAAFLRFFTSVFERLPELYVMPPAKVSARAVPADFFDDERLLGSFPEGCREWLALLLNSQAFTEFLHDRLTDDGTRLDIAFFNESIDAKRNRSRRTLTKRPTPLLSAGRLPARYEGRPPPRPVCAVYERLCAAAGRARPCASTKVAVLVVSAGGLDKERGRYAGALAAFVESLQKEFTRELLWTRLADAASGLVVHTVHWPSAGYQHFQQHGGGAGAAALEELALREAIFDLEALSYDRSDERARLRSAIGTGLSSLAQLCGARAPLCVVAHGAGGLLACEVLAELQAAASLPAAARTAGAADLAMGVLPTPLQRVETLVSVASLGVPLGARPRALELCVPSAHVAKTWPQLRGSWLHFHHREDVLCAAVGHAGASSVTDVECKMRAPKRGSAADPPPQLLYLLVDGKEIVHRVAKAFSRVWQESNMVPAAVADVQAIEDVLQSTGVI